MFSIPNELFLQCFQHWKEQWEKREPSQGEDFEGNVNLHKHEPSQGEYFEGNLKGVSDLQVNNLIFLEHKVRYYLNSPSKLICCKLI